MTEKRFVKYDGNTIIDLKLVKSWIISNGNVELLLEILNNEKTSKKIINEDDLSEELDYYKTKCASLETGLFQVDKENEQLRKENKKLKSINNQLENRLEESGIGIALRMEDLND